MARNEALGKAPTMEEEMSKFQGFSTKDGEVSDGKSSAEENAALEANNKPLSQRQAEERAAAEADKGGKGKEGKEAAQAVELDNDEKEAAITAAADKKGEELTEDEEKAAVTAAQAEKATAAAKEARKQAKAARYNDNHRAARAAERRADAAERRAEALERRLEALERGEKPARLTEGKGADNDSSELVKPDHTDTAKYEYGELDPKYLAALSRYESLKAIRDEKAREGESKQTKADAEAAAEFKERVATFAEEGDELYDDFQEVVMDNLANDKTNPEGWPCSDTVGELMLESEHGKHIAYELASDIPEARRVYRLSPARQAIWFGQKEAELSAGSAAPTKTNVKGASAKADDEPGTKSKVVESKAPLPLPSARKLNGAGGNRVPSSATTDFQAFEAMARKGTQR